MMTWDFFFRLLVAGVLGAIIGLDREYRAKEAGFRTHFLVALGSALFMIVSKYGFWDILGDTGIGLDPSRIAAQVVSGIGFLGAGTIIIQKLFVRGLTTAAGIWATSAIGLAVGAGQYWLGISAMLLTLLGLEGLGYIFQKISQRNVLLIFTTTSQEVIKEVTDEIKRKKHTIMVKGYDLNLTRQEFKILELLLSKPDKVFSKQEIYDYAWDDYYIGEDKTVNVHISHIRSKIKQYTDDEYIETVWGIGFKLAE